MIVYVYTGSVFILNVIYAFLNDLMIYDILIICRTEFDLELTIQLSCFLLPLAVIRSVILRKIRFLKRYRGLVHEYEIKAASILDGSKEIIGIIRSKVPATQPASNTQIWPIGSPAVMEEES